MKPSSFERRQLANGLTVVTERRGLGPVVFSGIVYRVGSRDEQPGGVENRPAEDRQGPTVQRHGGPPPPHPTTPGGSASVRIPLSPGHTFTP